MMYTCNTLSENLNVGDHSKDLSVDGKIILEWILGKYYEKMWSGCMWLSGWEPVVSFCEHGNKPSVSITAGKYHD